MRGWRGNLSKLLLMGPAVGSRKSVAEALLGRFPGFTKLLEQRRACQRLALPVVQVHASVQDLCLFPEGLACLCQGRGRDGAQLGNHLLIQLSRREAVLLGADRIAKVTPLL